MAIFFIQIWICCTYLCIDIVPKQQFVQILKKSQIIISFYSITILFFCFVFISFEIQIINYIPSYIPTVLIRKINFVYWVVVLHIYSVLFMNYLCINLRINITHILQIFHENVECLLYYKNILLFSRIECRQYIF